MFADEEQDDSNDQDDFNQGKDISVLDTKPKGFKHFCRMQIRIRLESGPQESKEKWWIGKLLLFTFKMFKFNC